jgi:hypothetical protein
MESEVIKSFLVGLGFGIDEAGLAKFNKAVSMAALKVTALYASIKVAAAGIFWSISKISEGFEQMGYEYRIISPMINKTLLMRQALLSAYRAAGINIVKVIQESVRFNFSLAKTKFALEAIYKSVGAKFLPLLTKQMDIFRLKIYANMPRIQAMLEKFVKFIFKAFEATTILGARIWSILQRVYDFFKQLDEATGGWSTKILGAVAAWKILNLAFLATPLGMLLTGLLAILALYDDFKVWQEGGESFFDWSSFIPVIEDVGKALSAVKDYLGSIMMVVFDVVGAFVKLFSLDFAGFKDDMLTTFKDIGAVIGKWIDMIKSLGGALGTFAGWAVSAGSSLFGSNNAAPTLNNMMQPAPLMPQGGTSQHVSQATNILVQGSADATATGRAVASEQSRVNFDMTRNLKGAAR